jgi:predicted nucleotidyltransferase
VETSISARETEIQGLCQRYGVARLGLFGSAVREDFDHETSDLDFVVSFLPKSPSLLFDRYFGLKEELEELFGREVDLLMEGAMKSPHLIESVGKSHVPLYES